MATGDEGIFESGDKKRLDRIHSDLYLWQGQNNPPITFRIATVEENVRVLELADKQRREHYEKKTDRIFQALIGLTVSVLAAVIAAGILAATGLHK